MTSLALKNLANTGPHSIGEKANLEGQKKPYLGKYRMSQSVKNKLRKVSFFETPCLLENLCLCQSKPLRQKIRKSVFSLWHQLHSKKPLGTLQIPGWKINGSVDQGWALMKQLVFSASFFLLLHFRYFKTEKIWEGWDKGLLTTVLKPLIMFALCKNLFLKIGQKKPSFSPGGLFSRKGCSEKGSFPGVFSRSKKPKSSFISCLVMGWLKRSTILKRILDEWTRHQPYSYKTHLKRDQKYTIKAKIETGPLFQL